MMLFALEDMLLKAASVGMPVGQILMLFGAGGSLGFLLFGMRSAGTFWSPLLLSPPMLMRAVFESAGRLFFVLSLSLAPLTTVSAIVQATPVIVVAGAALFLGERVGWRRWVAICVGFIGVLMILRPGPESFRIEALVALLGTLGFAGRDLATRMAPRGLSNAQLGFCGFVVLIPTGAFLLAVTGESPVTSTNPLIYVAAGTAVGMGSYVSLTAAMRLGDVSVVAPIRYSRLLFGVLLGIVFFGERPDVMTVLGSLVVICAGLFLMFRGRQVER